MQTLQCDSCGRITSVDQAEDRNFNPGRCICGGELRAMGQDDELRLQLINTFALRKNFSLYVDIDTLARFVSSYREKGEIDARINELENIAPQGSMSYLAANINGSVSDRLADLLKMREGKYGKSNTL